MDRLVLEDGIAGRLAEGVELALKEGSGLVRVLNVDSGDEWLFSEHNACVDCSISFAELIPQCFSFNSPQGACPACSGLGTSLEVDPNLVIPDMSLSIRQGAIKLWGFLGNHKDYFEPYLNSFVGGWDITVDTPLADYPPEAFNALMYGGSMTWRGRKRKFEGVAHNIKRLYHQTQSEGARRWYSEFFADKPCPECGGKRLKPESLAVKILDTGIDEVVDWDIGRALQWTKTLPKQLDSQSRTIAAELLKEIGQRLPFPQRCGAELPDAVPQRPDAIRRREPADPPGQPDRQRVDRGALRAGRTEYRPAPAGQPQADRHPGEPARPRQHGAGG